ncbi:MAG: photosynthetic complex putative assembly protein PuhB [Pseudomonadota bacterium]
MTDSFPSKLHSETGGPEHDFEPIPGLPAELPEGERIVWQGRPNWRVLLRQRLRVWWIVAYFAAIGGWVVWSGQGIERSLENTLGGLGLLAVAGMLVVGFLAVFAVLVQRTSLYTITNKRIVMRVGVALSATYNLPFSKIENVDLRASKSGWGEVAVQMSTDGMRLAWLMLWPHVRPWRINNTEPQLVGLKDAVEVGSIISEQVIGFLARAHNTDEQSLDTAEVADGFAPQTAAASGKPAPLGQLATQ